MSSLSPQISSFSNPFNISADSIKFSLDFNQSIPNIMNSNSDYLMNDSNAFISKNTLLCPSADVIVGEKKMGSEPLKQYFSALADATEGTNVLPLPDKKNTYGVYNVAYRENNCLQTPEPKEIQIPELNNSTTVTSTVPSTSFVQQNMGNIINQHPTINAYPPSPISPKIRVNSPYSFIDSNATLTPSSRNETSTPVSSLTLNSNSSIVDDDSYTQCNYENNSKNTFFYNNNPQLNTQPFFSNINNQRNLEINSMNQNQITTTTSTIQQNLYYVNINGNWKLHQHPPQQREHTCFYDRRKQELKNITSPVQVPLRQVKLEQVPLKPVKIENNAEQTSSLIPSSLTSPTSSPIFENNMLIPKQENANDVKVSFQYPSNYQVQVASSVINNNTNANFVPQVIVQSNSPVHQIIVQQPTQHVIYQPTIINDPNATNIMVQQHVEPIQQVIVQSQVPSVAVSSVAMNSPLEGSSVNVPMQQQSSISTQPNTIQQVVVQLQSYQSASQQPTNTYSATAPMIKKETSPSNIIEDNERKEPAIITPVSSPIMENPNPMERQTVIINLADFKPISSHINNFKNNMPAVLKYVPAKSKPIPRRKPRIFRDSTFYKCDICQKEFLKYYQLKSHLRIHLKEKPYKCEYCSRAFCRRHDLSRHIRIHTGDTPYICSNCFKGFARSDACTRHVRQNLCQRSIISYNPDTGDMEVAI